MRLFVLDVEPPCAEPGTIKNVTNAFADNLAVCPEVRSLQRAGNGVRAVPARFYHSMSLGNKVK